MTSQSQELKSMDKALWRYGIIAPLLHRHPGEISQDALLAELATKCWVRPGQSDITLSPETLRKWLYRYQKGGLSALADQPRQNKGSHRIPQKLVDALHKFRKEHP